jgi:xylulokinase
LTTSHGQASLVRAVLEGVALAFYDAYQVLVELNARPERIIMAGGGARSPLWRQIMADVFDLPVQRLETGDQSALGALLLAGAGIGLFEPDDAAQSWVTYGPPLEPDSGRHAIYQSLLPMFRGTYQKHREDFPRYSVWKLKNKQISLTSKFIPHKSCYKRTPGKYNARGLLG